jgi:hypothetical protein
VGADRADAPLDIHMVGTIGDFPTTSSTPVCGMSRWATSTAACPWAPVPPGTADRRSPSRSERWTSPAGSS